MPRRNSRKRQRAPDLHAVIDDVAGVALHQVHQQPRGGRLAAAGFADDADGLALGDRERHVVDRAHGLARAEQIAAHRKMLGQAVDLQQRLRRAADDPRSAPAYRSVERSRSWHQFRMSMALRMPSLSRLKQIDTAKIIAPGNAATHGLT